MPTTNPRINVTLSPSLDALVSRMAGHQRVSKSQVLRELLEAAEPALQRVVALMDAATTASAEARSGLARRLDRDIDAAEDGLAVMLARLDRSQTDLVSQAEAVQGKRPARQSPEATKRRAAVRLRNPPASNRGVKSPRAGKKGATQRATKAGRS